MQHIVVEQLGMVLTGQTPREYVRDIRTTILYILNVLVTRQRPKFLMKMPKYKRAKARMFELGHKMIRQYEERIAAGGATHEEYKTLIGAGREAPKRDPALVPKGILVMLMTGPSVAGHDTVAQAQRA